MKKLLALALTLALALSLSVSVFAGYIVGDRKDGGTGTGTYNDGATTLPSTGSESTVAIKVAASDVQHRYAIDVTYQDMTLNISGSTLEWDVNNMYYVPVGANTMTNQTKTITITNYSDEAITVAPSVSKVYDDDGISITTDIPADATIAKATPGTYDADALLAKPGSTTPVTYNVTIAADWVAVANYYAPKLTPGSALTIATLTLTINKK